MQPHPRIRKTIKWGGLALTVLLVAVWIGSGWYGHMWFDVSGDAVSIAGGAVTVSLHRGVGGARPYLLGRAGFPVAWRIRWVTLGPYEVWSMPLWVPGLV